jgi:hypothetical protein
VPVTTTAKVSDPSLSEIFFAIAQEYSAAKHQVYVACGLKQQPFQGPGGVLTSLIQAGWSDGFAKSLHNEALAAKASALACTQLEYDDKAFKLQRAQKKKRWLQSQVARRGALHAPLQSRARLGLATEVDLKQLTGLSVELQGKKPA